MRTNYKRLISICMSLAILLSLTTLPALADNKGTLNFGPNQGGMCYSQYVDGNLTSSNSKDIYSVTLPEAGRLSIPITNYGANGLPNKGATVVVWENSNLLVQDTFSFPFNLVCCLEAGTYRIEVTAQSGSTGEYTINAVYSPAGNNEIEPNNTFNDAQVISMGQRVIGFISIQDEVDYYRYDLAQPAKLTVNVGSEGIVGIHRNSVTVKWYDSSTAEIPMADSIYDGYGYSKSTTLPAGTYYIAIRRNPSDNATFYATGTYSISISEAAADNITITASAGFGGTATGGGSYAMGATVTLVAQPNNGYTFEGWYENGVMLSSSESYSFTATASKYIEARFTQSGNQMFNIMVTGAAGSPGIIDGAGGTATASVSQAAQGTTVYLSATPFAGFEFDYWLAVSDSSPLVHFADANSQTTSFIMPTANVRIMAVFAEAGKSAKTVAVGAQSGQLTAGKAGTVTYPVTVGHFDDGTYSAVVENLPSGVNVTGQVTIKDGAGTLTLTANATIAAGTRNNLTLELEGVKSEAFTLTIGAASGSAGNLSNFTKANTFTAGQFTDVDEDQWYGYNKDKVVASAFEYGLMKGVSDTEFRPSGSVTIAQAVTIACRVHSIYTTGAADFQEMEGSGWFTVYMRYALEHGIPANFDFTKQATRAEMAYIFAHALPKEEFAKQNTVNSLPDVFYSGGSGGGYYAAAEGGRGAMFKHTAAIAIENPDTLYGESIFMLYEAGILTGSDSNGTFRPDSDITRAEAAAIICRVILPAIRVCGRTY